MHVKEFVDRKHCKVKVYCPILNDNYILSHYEVIAHCGATYWLDMDTMVLLSEASRSILPEVFTQLSQMRS